MRIYIAGHKGMVGSALVRQLADHNLITRTHSELDLTNQVNVKKFIQQEKPDQIYLAAAKVGGIHANKTFPAEFIYQNLMIQANVINAAFENNVKRLLFLGSSCIYPKSVNQPMSEEALLTDKLEETNEPYAIAKIAGIKLCESFNRQYATDYRSIMPTNLYGSGDNYHPENSHVIPALIRRFHEAKANNYQVVKIWGSGNPCREFLHVDDMSAAAIYVMNLDKDIYREQTLPMLSHINAGSGEEISIKDLAKIISKIIGYKGKVVFDTSKPDGPPRKLMDSTRLKSLGWHPKIALEQGLFLSYKDYLQNANLIKYE